MDKNLDKMPIGAIVLWTKTSSQICGIDGIPDGWEICDGRKVNSNNGKEITLPNLSNQFVNGTNSIINSEICSGKDYIELMESNIPDISDRIYLSLKDDNYFNPDDKGNGYAGSKPISKKSNECSVFIKYGMVGDDHNVNSADARHNRHRFYRSIGNGVVSMNNFCRGLKVSYDTNIINIEKAEKININLDHYTALYIMKIK